MKNLILKGPLTYLTLRYEWGACREQVELFRKTFGDSAELTPENFRRAVEVGLDVYHFAPKFLGDERADTMYRDPRDRAICDEWDAADLAAGVRARESLATINRQYDEQRKELLKTEDLSEPPSPESQARLKALKREVEERSTLINEQCFAEKDEVERVANIKRGNLFLEYLGIEPVLEHPASGELLPVTQAAGGTA